MSKVVICAPCPPPRGGIATWVDELSSLKDENEKWEIVWCNTANTRRGPGTFTYTRRLYDGAFLIFGQIRRFWFEINDNEKPQVVHISTSGGLSHFRDLVFILLARLKGIAVCLQLHYGCGDSLYKWRIGIKPLLKLCCYFASTVAVFDRAYSEKNKKSFLTINGLSDFLRENETHDKAKEIVFIGWVIENKGIFDLLDAWDSIVDKNGWKLIIAGPADPHVAVRLQKYLQCDSIKYHGEVSRNDVVGIFNKASVFAMPSYTEGLPYAMLEAMRSRCALLLSDVGGISEVFAYDDCGVLINPGDVESIKNALDFFISDNSRSLNMGLASYKIYSNNYTANHMQSNLYELWNGM